MRAHARAQASARSQAAHRLRTPSTSVPSSSPIFSKSILLPPFPRRFTSSASSWRIKTNSPVKYILRLPYKASTPEEYLLPGGQRFEGCPARALGEQVVGGASTMLRAVIAIVACAQVRL
jgi:hypothetical protein